MTVSRTLRDDPRVSPETRERVLAAVADLGYRRNELARTLRLGGTSGLVGLVVTNLANPFYSQLALGVEAVAGDRGLKVVLGNTGEDPMRERRLVEELTSRRVDGIIVLTGRLSNQALRACAKALAVVVTGRTLKAPNLFSLNSDGVGGARLAIEHLLALGHKRIACITGDQAHPDAVERLQGCRQALEQAGIALDPGLVATGRFNEESGRLAIAHLLDSRRRFTAPFASNDQMAFGATLALYRRGLRVPDDLSLVGFDDLGSASYAIPPSTTVQQPGCELGRIAARAMLQLLGGTQPDVAMPAPRLVVRESTSAPRR